MATAIRLQELRALGKGDRDKAIGCLVDEALGPVNGRAFVIKAKIHSYESRYEMSSAQLGERLRNNSIRETAEVRDWLFWLRVRDLSDG